MKKLHLHIRPEQLADTLAIAQLTRLAFDMTDGSEVQMIEQIRASENFVPDLSLVATSDDQIVGHALFSYVQLEGRRPIRVLSLGPVSVNPEVQRCGIGTALIRHGLTIARHRNEALVVVLGHPEYYPRFGFVKAERFGLQPDWDAMMVCPLKNDLERFRGLRIPH